MKTFKLLFHTSKSPKNQDILISAKDFPDVRVGDVLEVYHPEDEWNRVLLQVKSLPDDSQQKETVIIEPAIANAFSLRQYHNVVVNKVETETVRLDLVELLFKELYFGRSDMWRLCKALTNTCVYLKKQIDFVEKRVHINELWARGDNVTCGVITEDTRFVFRSPTAVVQIFIQMSTEMWDFDLHGDLYLEKAVNGFLTDLFDKWKEQNCVHDVTIVLFSRTFYDAKSIDEFPPAIRECLFIDYKGRIYEDYYRVIVQNERYEEWQSVLRQIRTLCNCYRDLVLNYHKERFPEWKMPNASLSVAAQGNFLETLNMSLNLFENYYMDRNFDRTGKVSVVVTPGPGVFEVDRQLANITKQRTIDCGVGSDLVCMGEQPLHAAPLFKFHSKMTHMSIEVGDDYNIPHWMNHSFYMSKPQIHEHTTYAFVPRIKPPPALMKELEDMQGFSLKSCFSPRESSDDNIPFVDYDEYDAQVFKLPSGMASRNTVSLKRGASSHSSGRGTIPKTFEEARQRLKPRDRHQSDDVSVYFCDHPPSSPPITIPSARSSFEDMSFFFGREASKSSYESSENDELLLQRPVVGSAGSPVGHSRHLQNYRPHRALINPFAPSRLQFKMTSNRRRWAHAFPVDQKGMAMQARHIHSVEHNEQENDFPWSEKGMVKSPVITVTTSLKKQNLRQDSSEPGHAGESVPESPLSRSDHGTSSNVRRNIMDSNLRRQQSSKSTLSNKIQIFGSSKGGEQEWSSDMTTGYDWRPITSDLQNKKGSRLIKSIFRGDIQSNAFVEGITVDWKSLTIPATLPVTTDYFPDRRSLQYDYVMAEYELLPECVNAEIWSSWPRSPTAEDKTLLVYRRHPLTNRQVFLELISQRLGEGFQIITKKKSRNPPDSKESSAQSPSSQFMRTLARDPKEEYYMSIGRIYHRLTLSGQTIKVMRFWPRHPQPQLHYGYKYRFQAPDSNSYDVSWTNFSNEKLENYNWNHLDQYICTQGDWEYGLIDALKYWRSRFFLLPLNNPATKKIIEDEKTRCDIYEEKSPKELSQLISGFIRFLETMNKLKRAATQRKSKGEVPASGASAGASGSGAQLTSFSGPMDLSSKKPEQESFRTKDTEDRLSISSSSVKIVEGLVDTVHGLNFIQGQAGLPLNTFISAEAVDWCQRNVVGAETVSSAVDLMQRLLDDQYILHCSGNVRHKFIYGFYLFYILPKVKAAQPSDGNTHPALHFSTPGSTFNYLFQNEWCEVSILPIHEEDSGLALEENKNGEEPGRSHFFVQMETSRRRSDSMLQPELEDWRVLTGHREGPGQQPGYGDPYYTGGVRINDYYKATLLHKYTNVEVDPGKKSDRNEYAIARYHAYYSPKCAFELQLQWMVATGCIMGDLVQTYARRATSCGFHLIPVPCDPFALPYTENSDPLRGPIFVPLNMKAFDSNLFQDISNERRQEMLFIIQDAMIKRFGFLPASVKVPEDPEVLSGEKANINHQYVHCTAGMFILIPESTPAKPELSSNNRHNLSENPALLKKSSSELHQLYISRLGRPEAAPNGVGFLWSWNYMSSRRWRSPSTGDEIFQDRMLADFRKFCANDENRLSEFWENCKGSLNITR
ncbi:DEP domain-containing protein 5 [Biomphalaria glabrata]|nr:DEP domain-containing protein 5-like [Biomphalaria glabrata]